MDSEKFCDIIYILEKKNRYIIANKINDNQINLPDLNNNFEQILMNPNNLIELINTTYRITTKNISYHLIPNLF